MFCFVFSFGREIQHYYLHTSCIKKYIYEQNLYQLGFSGETEPIGYIERWMERDFYERWLMPPRRPRRATRCCLRVGGSGKLVMWFQSRLEGLRTGGPWWKSQSPSEAWRGRGCPRAGEDERPSSGRAQTCLPLPFRAVPAVCGFLRARGERSDTGVCVCGGGFHTLACVYMVHTGAHARTRDTHILLS